MVQGDLAFCIILTDKAKSNLPDNRRKDQGHTQSISHAISVNQFILFILTTINPSMVQPNSFIRLAKVSTSFSMQNER